MEPKALLMSRKDMYKGRFSDLALLRIAEVVKMCSNTLPGAQISGKLKLSTLNKKHSVDL